MNGLHCSTEVRKGRVLYLAKVWVRLDTEAVEGMGSVGGTVGDLGCGVEVRWLRVLYCLWRYGGRGYCT